MTDFLPGLVAVGVGLLLCLRGATVLRVLVTVWASRAGFVPGAGVVAATTDDSFLAGVVLRLRHLAHWRASIHEQWAGAPRHAAVR